MSLDKKEEIVKKLESDIENLKKKIKEEKQNNLKLANIRNIKILGKCGQLIGPYILIGSLLAGGSKLIGMGWPFKIDEEVKRYAYVTT